MSGPRYLFDASSLILALKESRVELLEGQAVQQLTVYEVLNALWKEARLLRVISVAAAARLAHLLGRLLSDGYMVVLEPKGLEAEILGVALELGLTAYDASYVVLASRHGLTLVTEDRKLASAAKRYSNVVGLRELARGVGPGDSV